MSREASCARVSCKLRDLAGAPPRGPPGLTHDRVRRLAMREQTHEIAIESDLATHEVQPEDFPGAGACAFRDDADALLAHDHDVRLSA